MPSINGQPVLPGVYDQVQQQLLASVTGGIRVACYIGTGRLTNLVTGESVDRGNTGNVNPDNDTLAHLATVLDGTTITDQNYAVYKSGVDYAAAPVSGGIGWLSGAAQLTSRNVEPFAGLVGKTFSILVSGGSIQTYAFVSDDFAIPSAATAAEVATALIGDHSLTGTAHLINGNNAVVGTGTAFLTELSVGSVITDGTTQATVSNIADNTHLTLSAVWSGSTNVAAAISRVGFTSVTATDDGFGHVQIATVGTTNTSLTIENGTSYTILGFTAGSLAATPSRPVNGVTYFANYEWAKAVGDGQHSFEPQFFFVQNFGTITTAMGTVGGGDGQPANMDGNWTLPVAAQIAQLNGASIVCLMQMNPADGADASQVRAALQKLFIPHIDIIVSLAAGQNALLIPDLTAHVQTASSTINRLECTTFIGFPAASNPDDATMLGYATAASSNRVVVVNQTNTAYTMFIGTDTTPTVVDGTMMAAALAALRTNPAFDVAQPLTRSIVSGIATTNSLAQAEKVILSNGGVLIVDNISGSPKVVFGTTTSFDTILNQLYQVTEISDYCAQTLRGLLDPIFIGQKLLTDTPSQVETVSGAIMQTIQDSRIINSFVQPTATVNPTQPTQILLQVGIQPVLELDTILITLGLNLA